MDIGPPRRIIEVEPVSLPVPETLPEPERIPEPVREPAGPGEDVPGRGSQREEH